MGEKRDPVEHYMRGGIECIDAMKAISTPEEFRGYLRLTAFKYLWRLGEKDLPAKEAKKAGDYIKWLQAELVELGDSARVDAMAAEAQELGIGTERARAVEAASVEIDFGEELSKPSFKQAVGEFASKLDNVPQEIKDMSGVPGAVRPNNCTHDAPTGTWCSGCRGYARR